MITIMSETNESPKRANKKRPNMRSFAADEDVDQMLNDAVSIGAVQKDIINEALRRYAPAAIRAEAKRLKKKASEIEKRNTGAGNN